MKKEDLVRACRDFLVERINENKMELDTLQQDLLSESKSSAGDKHETGRAMIHLEAEKAAARLRENEDLLFLWDRIDFSEKHTVVRSGALITTDKGSFLHSVAAGKILVNNSPVHLLSASSPLIKAMNGKKAGDIIPVQQHSYHILSIE